MVSKMYFCSYRRKKAFQNTFQNLKFFIYDKAMAFLIVIFVVVVIIDILSMIIRSYVTDESDFKRPKWWTVLLPSEAAVKLHRKSLEEE